MLLISYVAVIAVCPLFIFISQKRTIPKPVFKSSVK